MFAQFVHQCQTLLPGTTMGPDDWRPLVNCTPLPCYAYNAQYYDPCGSSCENSCASHTGTGVNCTLPCYEGCQCINGYVVDNMANTYPATCIEVEDCGCTDANGNSHQRKLFLAIETMLMTFLSKSSLDGCQLHDDLRMH